MKPNVILISLSIAIVIIIVVVYFYLKNKKEKLAEAKRLFVLYADASKNSDNTKLAEYEKKITDLGFTLNQDMFTGDVILQDGNYNQIMSLPG